MSELPSQSFFTRLYKPLFEKSGYFTYLWKKQGSDTTWLEINKDFPALAANLAKIQSEKGDIYFGLGVSNIRKDAKKRPENEEICWIPGVWLELDWKDPSAHSKQNLFPDYGAALSFATNLALPPSMIVNSGNGLHLYWVIAGGLELPYKGKYPNLVEIWQQTIRSQAKELGYHVDSTFDLARVYRVPGTWNRKKSGEPKEVKLVKEGERRYSVAELEDYIDRMKVSKETEEKQETIRKGRGRPVKEENKPNIEKIRKLCGWMNNIFENQTEIDEPNWFAALSIAAVCQEPEEVAHSLSNQHPKYSPNETLKKLNHASQDKPRTCAFIEDSLGNDSICRKCKYRGVVKSPVSLGVAKAGEFVNRYIYIKELDKFYDRETQKTYDAKQIDAYHGQFLKGLSKALIEDHELIRVESLTYYPGQPELVDEDGNRCINSWKPNEKIEPKEGDHSKFLSHMEWMVPDEAARRTILDFLAYIVQNPGKKINFTILLIGEQGIGKSYLNLLMTHILGPHNCREITTAEISSDNNGWAVDKQLFFVEEIYASGKREITNKMKTLVTSHTLQIQEKYQRTYTAKNRGNFFLFSNHPDALYIDDDDRRYFVYHTTVAPRGTDYYDGLFADIEINGSAIFHYLLNRDIKDFKATGRAPSSEAKKSMIQNSKGDWEVWLDEQVKYENAPFTAKIISVDDLRNTLAGAGYSNIGLKAIGSYARRHGWQKREQVIINGRRCSVYMWKPDGTLDGLSTDQIREMMKDAVKEAM